MRNNPENIYDYYRRRSYASAPPPETVKRLAENLQEKHKDMKEIIISGKKYYSLPTGKDMGKSEKIPLISEENLEQAITNKTDLKPDALLKLPKNGVTNQVQSEGMALGIAQQALGLTTTQATMLSFEDRPALFVPFEDMEPLTKFAASDTPIIRSDSRVDHEQSSINPLGEGLSANIFVNDFGRAFALMYLTGDPDGIGGYNQNKGLQGRNLYVFDHAIVGHDSSFSNNYFQIDSRLRQTPKIPYSFSRHTKGRNFSLLEDASIEEKFESLSPQNCEKTLQYTTDVIRGLEERTTAVPQQLRTQHMSLIASARNARNLIADRIETYNKMLPKAINNTDRETIKQALILENILNQPRMYSKTGRPYRSLFAEREHSLKVDSVEATTGSDNVKIKFNKNLDEATLRLVSDRLGGNNVRYNFRTKSMEINKNLLINLENIFYPEKDTKIDQNINYTDLINIKKISRSYIVRSDYCIRVVNHYNKKQADAKESSNDQEIISNIIKARIRLSDPVNTATNDKGFNNHIIRCFEFEAQKELQKIISKNIGKNHQDRNALLRIQNQAFSTAVKLDCLQEFNNLCVHAAKNIHKPEIQVEITQFLKKYASLDLSDSTISEAHQIRSQMLQDINHLITLKPQLSRRRQIQESYKKAAASVREVNLEIDSDDTLENNKPQSHGTSLN